MKIPMKLAGLILALAACSCSRAPKATKAPATRVKAEAVEMTKQSTGRCYSGTIEESSGSVLSFSVAGMISKMHVGVGAHVAKGQLIASLDASNLQHAYEIALATLNQVQDAYDRMKKLHDANLYAQASGYVSEKIADAGMNVAPGMPVVKVVDIAPVKVSISVPENEIASIEGNAVAQITVGAIGGKRFFGKLTEKGVAANQLSRSYDVKFEVSNPDRELLPGMICDVAMATDTMQSVIAVPSDAVLLDSDNQNFVWLAMGGKAEKRIVETDGMTANTRIIIASGLSVGDSIIVSGQQKVSQGTDVINVSK